MVSNCKETGERYSFLWSKYQNTKPPERYHFNSMQEVIPERIVRGAIGLDLGCGCGWDTFIMAKSNPSVRIIGMDLNKGIYMTSRLQGNLKNAIMVRGSASDIPLKDEACDFVYSFGVLHHMSDYKKGFQEIYRVLKRGAPAFLYLYEDHSDNPLKYIAVKIVSVIRRFTVKISPSVLYILSFVLSPFLVLLFSYPAKMFKRSKFTYKLYEKMPFNFGTSLFSLRGDIYDRLATPIEFRFNRETLYSIFEQNNFTNTHITRLKTVAGLVVWAYKKNDV